MSDRRARALHGEMAQSSEEADRLLALIPFAHGGPARMLAR